MQKVNLDVWSLKVKNECSPTQNDDVKGAFVSQYYHLVQS